MIVWIWSNFAFVKEKQVTEHLNFTVTVAATTCNSFQCSLRVYPLSQTPTGALTLLSLKQQLQSGHRGPHMHKRNESPAALVARKSLTPTHLHPEPQVASWAFVTWFAYMCSIQFLHFPIRRLMLSKAARVTSVHVRQKWILISLLSFWDRALSLLHTDLFKKYLQILKQSWFHTESFHLERIKPSCMVETAWISKRVKHHPGVHPWCSSGFYRYLCPYHQHSGIISPSCFTD